MPHLFNFFRAVNFFAIAYVIGPFRESILKQADNASSKVVVAHYSARVRAICFDAMSISATPVIAWKFLEIPLGANTSA